MIGVIYHADHAYFNVMMSSGKHGDLFYTNKTEIKMTKQEPVSKITVYHGNRLSVEGFRFYSKSNEVLLEVGQCAGFEAFEYEL
jgi:hypothetical protein